MKKHKWWLVTVLVLCVGLAIGSLWYVKQNERVSNDTQVSEQLDTKRGKGAHKKSDSHEYAQSVPAKQAVQADPNQTATGQEVTMADIKKTQAQLVQAGLPADQWAPSDIKKIIVESSRLHMDVTTYAKQNFHGQS
ncbi:hypothetical protein [Weissella halotolerans]|uniref:hypothetical protein n=1 Tax=Weissella halotolerans TaxID=1615 RepID=UPI0003B42548|nr:hypothetical protein [Weissella halotolerans]